MIVGDGSTTVMVSDRIPAGRENEKGKHRRATASRVPSLPPSLARLASPWWCTDDSSHPTPSRAGWSAAQVDAQRGSRYGEKPLDVPAGVSDFFLGRAEHGAMLVARSRRRLQFEPGGEMKAWR